MKDLRSLHRILPVGRVIITLGAALCVLRPGPALAQDAAATLTVERIFGGDELSPGAVNRQWMPDGSGWTEVSRDAGGGAELWAVDAATGERRLLISRDELVPEGRDEAIDIEGHSLSRGARLALLFTDARQVWRDKTEGRYYVFDFESRRLTPVSRSPGWQMFAKFSPAGDRVAFAREHDLFVTDLATGDERRLTHDGSETIINGTTDWVYEEELHLRDAFRWSPDGQRIAYWQLDQSPVPVFSLLDDMPLYPVVKPVRYPKAGEPNSRVRVGSIELSTGHTTWFDLGPEENIYIPRMDWADSPHEVVIQRLNRGQNRLDLLLGDAHTGRTALLFGEESETWIDVVDDLRWVDGGSHFTWTSERDGFRHLYLYHRSGRLVRQLTRGEWDVTAFHGVDPVARRVYFTAAAESPLTRSVHAIDLEGEDPRLLAGGRGDHAPTFSPDFRFFLDTHSTVGTPPAVTLRRSVDGAMVRSVEDDEALRARLDSLDLREPEFFTLDADDGTPLHAYIIKPRNFDPSRLYPLLLHVYGGPGSQRVRDAWDGRRYLWHQMLVQGDMLVACVDNRGTGARGREFKNQVYLRLGQLESADQLAAVRQLGSLPYVDRARIGIWGWSYGGYLALLTALQGGGTVAAAVAGAPVTAWELYDTIYTERYMRTPAENPEGYLRGAPLSYAERLASALLVIHGTADDNVHPQHTMRLVSELVAAGKPFRMQLYPSQRHRFEGSATRVSVYRLMTDFLRQELGGRAEPEAAAPEGWPL